MKIVKEYLGTHFFGEEPERYYAVLHDKKKEITGYGKDKRGNLTSFKQTGRLLTFSGIPNHEFIMTKNENKDFIVVEVNSGMIADYCIGNTYEKALWYFINYSNFMSYINDEDKLNDVIRKGIDMISMKDIVSSIK